jgi:tetraacyldisaccharide 4'-kinase
MRARWIEAREQTPRARVALLPLDLAALGYRLGARLHRAIYECHLTARRRLSCQVVSVGGLTVGGSGKTPLSAWIAAGLQRRGHRVALASRGYRRAQRNGRVALVSDGRFVRTDVSQAGDEPLLLAAHAPAVPVLVGADRGVAGLRAIAAFGSEVLVLDDGFAHHRLARDVELVCFDGVFGFGNRRLLPRGPLREPPRALRRADGVLIVDGPLPETDAVLLKRVAPRARQFRARRRPTGLRALAGGATVSPGVLAGTRVGLLAGLAHPDSFRRSLESLGAEVVAERCFRDHHRYRPADLRGLRRQQPIWITTEKDAVKILPSWVGAADVRVLAIDLEVEEPERLLEWLESKLRGGGALWGRDAVTPR